MSIVLDASAVLAFLHDEPGAGLVEEFLPSARISTVNWSEVIQKTLARGVEVSGMQAEFSEVGTRFMPLSALQAEQAAALWQRTRSFGLSLADRACLALALDQQLPILTADRVWTELDVDVEIRLLR